jgi:aerobic carbon-monoxide dehydrogenase medium subunit
MKPARFEYAAPRSVEEAIEELRRSDGDAKILAGGQSLVPLLNMRLATPARLVDLNRVPELRYVVERDGGIAIGAMTRQRAVERDQRVAARVPLLAEAIRWVGHPAIRNRGTVGGSIAHGDPAAELSAVAVCLDARATIRGSRGERSLAAEELYLGYMVTTLEPDEVLTEVWFPAVSPNTGQAWIEFARRHGDYAIVGVGVSLTLHGDAVGEARLALTGVGGTPVRARAAEGLLAGGPLDGERLRAAAEAVRAAIEPDTDIHASAEYRRHLAGVLTERAVRLAHGRALEASGHGPAALDIRRSLEEMGRHA